MKDVIDWINALIPWGAWSVGLSVLGATVQLLAGPKPKWAWILGMISQVPWWIYAVASNQWGFFVSSTVYFAIYARHHIVLRRKERRLTAVADGEAPLVITVEPEEVPV